MGECPRFSPYPPTPPHTAPIKRPPALGVGGGGPLGGARLQASRAPRVLAEIRLEVIIINSVMLFCQKRQHSVLNMVYNIVD